MRRWVCGWLLLAAAAGGGLSGTGCAGLRQALGRGLVPVDRELELGRRLAAEVEAQNRVLPDQDLQRYVRHLAGPLLDAAWRDRPEAEYRLTVLDDTVQVNAFALPGGPIYVYTGLLRLAADEAEVAGVLAHELGHVVARHTANQLGTQFGLQLLAAIALGEEPEQLAQIAADLAGAGAMARFSRDDEREADDFGVRYAIAAGFDPRGLVTLFAKMGALESGAPAGWQRFLASHPATEERMARIERSIAKAGNPALARHAQRYRQMTASLRGPADGR